MMSLKEDLSTTQNGESCVKQIMPVVNIDPEIQSLIPPLTPNELSKLMESISAEGCRDPLVVWAGHNILLDGHNRFAICQKLAVSFRVTELSFVDREHAVLWILRNQLGRRNRSDIQFKLLIGQEHELMKKLEGRPKSDTSELPQIEAVIPMRTSEKIAREHGVSRATVERSADLYKALKVIRAEVLFYR